MIIDSMEKIKNLICANGHLIAILPNNSTSIDPKHIVNPKLKNLKIGDTLFKCPDCGDESGLFEAKTEKGV